jgi:hypothetical protein
MWEGVTALAVTYVLSLSFFSCVAQVLVLCIFFTFIIFKSRLLSCFWLFSLSVLSYISILILIFILTTIIFIFVFINLLLNLLLLLLLTTLYFVVALLLTVHFQSINYFFLVLFSLSSSSFALNLNNKIGESLFTFKYIN